jgi:exodeoxyribonuclease V alpha subunit
VYGIRKYLGSGLVPGIGKVYANKIVDAFGTDTFRVLSDESVRLRSVAGIGKVRATAIKKAWDDQRALREIHIFLQTYGVSTAQCVKLVHRYGPEAKQVLLKEPYRVAREIDGIGFKTADRIAINVGYANDAPPRLDAGLLFSMETLQEEGHTAVFENELCDYATQLLETSADRVALRIQALVESHHLVRHLPPDASATPNPAASSAALVQLPVQDRAENRIADAVTRLKKVTSALPPIKIDAALVWAEQKAGFEFADQQRLAVQRALSNKVSILTGGPGTGKTSCLRALVEVLKAKKVRVHLAAPTGRAAQRLAESTGGFASTIHRLLRFDPAKGGFTANEAHPLATDFLIVDEASMLDSRLAAALLQAVPSRAHLVLVGDTDQLPSVGAGNVLKDLIATDYVAVTRLNVIFRQKGQSQIVTTAHAINSGDASLPPTVDSIDGVQSWGDLTFVAAQSADDCVAKVLQLCTEYVPKHYNWFHPIRDLQVLAPMHKGTAGVGNLNQQLQNALNGGSRGLRAGLHEFRAGDKVIQLRNNYDKNLFNGDIGRITAVDVEEGTMDADFDGEKHTFDRGHMGDLALAYAISIHKSQGSEYPVVIIPLLKAHFMMLQRNLIYTAITRGRKKVFLVGEPAAYAMAVRNSDSKTRITHLRQKIASAAAAVGRLKAEG